MKSHDHDFLITARDKEVVFNLLNFYKIDFISRGKGGKGLINKLLYILKADFIICKSANKFKPDLFLSFGSPYAAHVAFISRKPHVAFDDTDHAPLEHALYVPFTNCIITPKSYLKDFKKKHIRINSYMELCSTHRDYFIPDEAILEELKLNHNERFVILRLVSWNASHDINLKGISHNCIKHLIQILGETHKILISSEAKLPSELAKYQFTLQPHKMHQALYFADLVIGESLTMGVEAITLGTPAFTITTAKAGVTFEQINEGILKKFESEQPLIAELKKFIDTPDYKKKFKERSKSILSKKTNVTKFMVWFIENYPNSFKILKDNPEYENNFTG
jgi:predicted glycosyltransferase